MNRCLVMVVLTFTACVRTTRTVPIASGSELRQGKRSAPIIIKAEHRRVRVDPQTELKFLRIGGLVSSRWIHARDLEVSDTHVVVRGAKTGWAWDEIEEVRVRGIDGALSLMNITGHVVTIGVASFALALAPVAGSAAAKTKVLEQSTGGSPGKGESRLGDLIPPTTSRSDGSKSPPAQTTWQRHLLPDPPDTWAPALVDEPTLPLFDARTRRRARARVLAVADFGPERGEGMTTGAIAAGVRLRDYVELGGGARHWLRRDESRFAWFVRAGAHVGLGATHRAAIVLGVDGGSDLVHVRIGLRVRFTKNWFIGGYPSTPTYLRSDAGWTYPALLEMGSAL